jgi:hypothetical protein
LNKKINEARVTPKWESDAIIDIKKDMKKTKVNLDKLLKAIKVDELNFGSSVISDIDSVVSDNINSFAIMPKELIYIEEHVNKTMTDLQDDYEELKIKYTEELTKLSGLLDKVLAMKG